MTLSAVSLSSLYRLMADLMSGCYAVTHNYALAIALLTLATVGITTPLTWKSSRGMIAMQALQPEMKKIQAKYKGDRVAMNEEMTKLYREAGINPLSGCLPLVPQMVVFYVLYHTIANLSHRATYATHALAASSCPTPAGRTAQIVLASGKYSCSAPTNLGTHSLLYQNLVAAGGHMKVFGFDLTLGVRTAHSSALIGCLILVALVVAAQYWQTRQVNRRNPGAAANPQAQMMQRIFPLFFGFISINIQAGVNVYFLVSALCRIAQQSLMFKYDPVLRRQLLAARTGKPVDLPPRSSRAAGGAGSGSGDQPDSTGAGGTGAGPGGRRGGGGIARLLGLADPDPAPGGSGRGATGSSQGRGNLDRFIGSSGGANGTLGGAGNGNGKNTGAKSTNNGAANGSSPATNPVSNGSSQSRRRGGPAGPSAKHQDRNRSKAKRRRSR